MARATHSQLLTRAQLESFRSQVLVKHEAAFLAPQLLEQVAVLTGELRDALDEIAALREAITQLTNAYRSAQHTGTYDAPEVLAAMTRLLRQAETKR